MSALNLDALRGRWKESQQQIDAQLQLDAQSLRELLARRTRGAYARHRFWLTLGTIGTGLVLLALIGFLWNHRADAIYRFLAAPLALLMLGEFIVDVRQWLSLLRLDLGLPVAQVQATLESLRGRRLRMTRWILLLSVMLWLPLILVLVKGLLGFDLLDVLHPSVLWVNLLLGLVFVPTTLLLGRAIAHRYRDRPGFQRFLDQSVGYSWSQAQQEWQAQRRFERDMDIHGAASVMAKRAAHPALLAQISGPLNSLKRRLSSAIAVYATLVLGTGLFNALHGGQPQLLIPALLLHALWLTHIVLAIAQRQLLARWHAQAESIDTLQAIVESIVQWRAFFARWTLIATPLLALALVQVLYKLVTGISLIGLLPPIVLAMALVLASLGCGLLWRRLSGKLGAFASAAINLISIGSLSAGRNLTRRLNDSMAE